MNFLSTAAMVGILSGRTKNGLNLINAPILANEAGLKVQVNHVASDKQHVTVVVSSPNVTHEVKGMLNIFFGTFKYLKTIYLVFINKEQFLFIS